MLVGKPSSSPPRTTKNELPMGRPVICWPFASASARPEYSDRVPRVAMIARILMPCTSSALTSPSPAPASTQTGTASHGFMPE